MAVRATIFDPDTEEPPAKREAYDDEFAGKFSAGANVNGKITTLSEFRAAVADMDTANAIAQLFGGEPHETESTSEHFVEVFTDADSISVILDGPDAIYFDYKLWINGVMTHHCDGSRFVSEAGENVIGEACGCPKTYAERKARARTYQGPKPSIEIKFRLADDPDLGLFKLTTGSWDFAYVLHQYDADLEDVGGEAIAELALESVSFKAKSGPMKGQMVMYTKPVLNRIRSYNDAIAE